MESKPTTRNKQTEPTRSSKQPRYTPEQVKKRQNALKAVIGIGGAGVALAFGGVHFEKATAYHDIDTTSVTVGQGDTPEGVVSEGRDQLAERNDINPRDIANVVPAAQHAADTLPSDRPGETIVVTLEQNKLGNYRVTTEGIDHNE